MYWRVRVCHVGGGQTPGHRQHPCGNNTTPTSALITFIDRSIMHSSAKLQSPLFYALFYCSCNTVHHKQEVRFLLYLPSRMAPDIIALITGLKLTMYCYK